VKKASAIPLCAALLIMVLLSGVTAWYRAFGSLAAYDDEGALMFFMQRVADGHALYDDVHTMYGPLYYVLQSAAHRLAGARITHDSVRVFSIACWIAAGLLLFLAVYRITGSFPLALMAYYVGFRALVFMGYEHAHPQELCILLLLLVVLAATSGRNAAAAWLGVLTAALLLTKINLGIITVAALAVVIALTWPRDILHRVLAAVAVMGALAVPFALMSAHLAQAGGLRYALLVDFSLLAAVVGASARGVQPFRARDLLMAAITGLISGGVIVGLVLARGTTAAAMLDNLVLWPRTHIADTFSVLLRVHTAAVIWAAAGLLLAWLASRGRLPDWIIAVLKLALACLVVLGVVLRGDQWLIGAATPMLWLTAIPNRERAGSLARAVLAVLGVLQVLYAYPVAGWQTGVVTVMMVVCAAVCVADVLSQASPVLPPVAIRLAPAVTAGLLVVLGAALAYSAYRLYGSLEPLGLPGARLVHIEPQRAAALRRIQAAAQSCSMLASLPGLFSLNLFSGTRVPSGIVKAGLPAPWMLFVSDSEQAAVVREMSAQAHPCAVYDPQTSTMWTSGRQPPDRPLVRYIRDELRTEFETGGYRFLVPKPAAP
jgi:hypothetical protein